MTFGLPEQEYRYHTFPRDVAGPAQKGPFTVLDVSLWLFWLLLDRPMNTSSSFTFVLIPADVNSPLELLSQDVSGGLTDDALIKHAKWYFSKQLEDQGGGAGSEYAALTERFQQASTTEEKQQLANQIRRQILDASDTTTITTAHAKKEMMENMSDDALLDFVRQTSEQQAQASCDIVALTVPTEANGHHAVSMYVSDHGNSLALPWNTRAMQLVAACGHDATASGIRGDAFVGRAHDNEMADIWQRVDFTIADADLKAEWCRVARQSGGGGGIGNATGAHSLNRLMQQQTQGMAVGEAPVFINNPNSNQATSAISFGANGSPPVEEPWGSWTQTNEEVELAFTVPEGTKAKDCKINFKRNSVQIAVGGNNLVEGQTFDPLETDDCTYTLHNEGPTRRKLVVTLAKTSNRTWSWALKTH